MELKETHQERVHLGALVDPEQRDQLAELARKRDRSISSIFRRAVAAELERATRTGREELMSQFGRVLDGDDVQHERIVATTTMRGYELSGGEVIVAPGGPWRTGVLYPEQPATIGSREHAEPRWFGSKVLEEPGR
jgi:predicted transcriptional regulator